MLITYNKVKNLSFPVFFLPKEGQWDKQDGVLWFNTRVVDDTNMPGETLGARRLQTPFSKLMPLPYSLATSTDLIRHRSGTYIDSSGMPFVYKKTRLCDVRYHLIKKIELKETACIVWVQGVKAPFKLKRPPEDGQYWAGLLYLGDYPWVIFEFGDERKPIRRVKV